MFIRLSHLEVKAVPVTTSRMVCCEEGYFGSFGSKNLRHCWECILFDYCSLSMDSHRPLMRWNHSLLTHRCIVVRTSCSFLEKQTQRFKFREVRITSTCHCHCCCWSWPWVCFKHATFKTGTPYWKLYNVKKKLPLHSVLRTRLCCCDSYLQRKCITRWCPG